MSGRLKDIGAESIHRICSSQVVSSLAVAVKELAENAVDAGATKLEIRLEDSGVKSVSVVDNGKGIGQQDHAGVAVKHATSKIKGFNDLGSVGSYGFRGEALSSLAFLSDLSITTRVADEEIGYELIYDKEGALVKTTRVAREAGTTVTIKNLFEPLPVRHREFKKNIKREYQKLIGLIQAYALICTDVKFTVKNKKKVVLRTSGKDLRNNIGTIFGWKQVKSVKEFKFDVDGVKFKGFLSDPKEGGQRTTDRQLYYLKSRPVDLPKLQRVINGAFRMRCPNRSPFVLLDIEFPEGTYDVNVTPDKRTVFIHNERHILDKLKEHLESIWDVNSGSYESNAGNVKQFTLGDTWGKSKPSPSRATPEPEELPKPAAVDSAVKKRPREGPSAESSPKRHRPNQSSNRPSQSPPSAASASPPIVNLFGNFGSAASQPKPAAPPKSSPLAAFASQPVTGTTKPPSQSPFASFASQPVTGTTKPTSQTKSPFGGGLSSFASTAPTSTSASKLSDFLATSKAPAKRKPSPSPPARRRQPPPAPARRGVVAKKKKPAPSPPSSQGFSLANFAADAPANARARPPPKPAPEPMDEDIEQRDAPPVARPPSPPQAAPQTKVVEESKEQIADVELPWSLDEIKSRFRSLHESSAKSAEAPGGGQAKQGEGDMDGVSNSLRRLFDKQSFKEMKIIGQFNLGFIIATHNGDLFIIDQHATDEKYNFEQIKNNTKVASQPMINPVRLEIPRDHELTMIEHRASYERNGFRFKVEDDAEPTQQILITAMPFAKGKTFSTEDAFELTALINDGHDPDTVILPKVLALFASKACRKSIMIGTAINKHTMRTVLDHMSGLEHPWNCPHGRPTMRHLFSLESNPTQTVRREKIAWKNLLQPA